MFSMIFAKMTHFAADADSLPGVDNGLEDYVKDQAGTAVIIVVVALVAFFLVKQSWGRLLGTVFIGGIVYFIVGEPKDTLETVGNIADLIMGG